MVTTVAIILGLVLCAVVGAVWRRVLHGPKRVSVEPSRADVSALERDVAVPLESVIRAAENVAIREANARGDLKFSAPARVESQPACDHCDWETVWGAGGPVKHLRTIACSEHAAAQ